MSGYKECPVPTPEEVKAWDEFCLKLSEKPCALPGLFDPPKTSSGPETKNIYAADDFTWRATRLVKGGLAPPGKVLIRIKVSGLAEAGALLDSNTTHDERRIVAHRLREQLRLEHETQQSNEQ